MYTSQLVFMVMGWRIAGPTIILPPFNEITSVQQPQLFPYAELTPDDRRKLMNEIRGVLVYPQSARWPVWRRPAAQVLPEGCGHKKTPAAGRRSEVGDSRLSKVLSASMHGEEAAI
jgi:hypothetical protein